jgi:hypothetical protein
MFLLFAILSSASSSPPPSPKVERRAGAAVQIVRGRAVSAESWRPAANSAQRETVHVEPDGRRTLLRLTEFQ